MPSGNVLPQGASEGFKDASSYDTYRPSYPDEAVNKFLKQLALIDEAHANVVEIAAGTGKFTELLTARHEAFDLVAVEPHELMRQKLVEKNLRGVKVVEGFAEKIPVEDGWGDACIAAQSFHWFANERALKEIHRILKPASVFGMIWNIEDYNKPAAWPASTPWEEKLNKLIHSLGSDGNPRFRDGEWKQVFERQLDKNPLHAIRDVMADKMPLFSLPIGEDKVKWTVWLSEEALWLRLKTLSQIVILKGQAEQDFEGKFKEIMAGKEVERNEKGEVPVHGITFFAWTSRL